MGDEGEFWNAVREQSRKHKEENRDSQKAIIEFFVQNGDAKEFTAYCYRFWGFLDIYPSNKKWFDVKTKKRGRYNDLAKFLEKQKILKQPS